MGMILQTKGQRMPRIQRLNIRREVRNWRAVMTKKLRSQKRKGGKRARIRKRLMRNLMVGGKLLVRVLGKRKEEGEPGEEGVKKNRKTLRGILSSGINRIIIIG